MGSKDMKFYSSDSPRALESGKSQIAGIFPLNSISHILTEKQKKKYTPPLWIDDPQEINNIPYTLSVLL